MLPPKDGFWVTGKSKEGECFEEEKTMKTSTTNHSCDFSEEEVYTLRNVAFPKIEWNAFFNQKKYPISVYS